MKPLFIPLKSEYYEAFKNGSKREEFRLYGQRWNEQTCPVGREVLLSKGYGTKDRLTGLIRDFKRQHAASMELIHHQSILNIYGTLNVEIARIQIEI